MKFLKKSFEDFKAFAFKGNVMDMAVGVVIGGAFGAVVTSLVTDIISPVIGKFTSGIDFKEMKWVISNAEIGADGAVVTPEVAIMFGAFIQSIIYFLLVAISIFIFVKIMKGSSSKVKGKVQSSMKKGKAAEPAPAEPAPAEEAPAEPLPAPEPAENIQLLTEIRDLLKAANQPETSTPPDAEPTDDGGQNNQG